MRRSHLTATLAAAAASLLLAGTATASYHGPTDTNVWYAPKSSVEDSVTDAAAMADTKVGAAFLAATELTGLDVYVSSTTFPSAAAVAPAGSRFVHVNVGHPYDESGWVRWAAPKWEAVTTFTWTAAGTDHEAKLLERTRRADDGTLDISSTVTNDGKAVECGYLRRDHVGGDYSGPRFESYVLPVACVPSGTAPVTTTFTLRRYVAPATAPHRGATDTVVGEKLPLRGPGSYARRAVAHVPAAAEGEPVHVVVAQDQAAHTVTVTSQYGMSVDLAGRGSLRWRFADPALTYTQQLVATPHANGTWTLAGTYTDRRGQDPTTGTWDCATTGTVVAGPDRVAVTVPRDCFTGHVIRAVPGDAARGGYSPEIYLYD